MYLLNVVIPEVNKEVEHMGVLHQMICIDAYSSNNKCHDTLTEKFKEGFAIYITLKGKFGFTNMNANQDIFSLIGLINDICCQSDDQFKGTYALNEEKRGFVSTSRGNMVVMIPIMETSIILVEVAEIYGGAYSKEPGVIKEELEDLGVDDSDADDTNNRSLSESIVRKIC